MLSVPFIEPRYGKIFSRSDSTVGYTPLDLCPNLISRSLYLFICPLDSVSFGTLHKKFRTGDEAFRYTDSIE